MQPCRWQLSLVEISQRGKKLSKPGSLSGASVAGSKMLRVTIIVILLLSAWPRESFAGDAAHKYPPTIVFMTDFGVLDDSVAICRGVMYGIMPEVRIVDLTHQVTPFSIVDGARFLFGRLRTILPKPSLWWLSTRQLGVRAKRLWHDRSVGNTSFCRITACLRWSSSAMESSLFREITNPDWMIGSKLSSTFHGRDIFSPVGAHMARGDEWSNVGPEMPVKDLVRLELQSARVDDQGLSGMVIATDGPFGNLVTNVSAEDFLKLGYQRGQEVPLKVGGKDLRLKFVKTFSDVPVNQSLVYIDSRGHLALAVNQNSFAATYGIKPPVSLVIPRAGGK